MLLVFMEVYYFCIKLFYDKINNRHKYIVCGFWGVINTGIFAYDKDDIAFAGYSDEVVELPQGYRFGIQFMAAVVIAGWTLINGCIMFGILKACKRLRISEEDEKKGLDMAEHGGIGVDMRRSYSVRPTRVLSKDELNNLKDDTN